MVKIKLSGRITHFGPGKEQGRHEVIVSSLREDGSKADAKGEIRLDLSAKVLREVRLMDLVQVTVEIAEYRDG